MKWCEVVAAVAAWVALQLVETARQLVDAEGQVKQRAVAGPCQDGSAGMGRSCDCKQQ
jgi:hypothetical protein